MTKKMMGMPMPVFIVIVFFFLLLLFFVNIIVVVVQHVVMMEASRRGHFVFGGVFVFGFCGRQLVFLFFLSISFSTPFFLDNERSRFFCRKRRWNH
jgi:fucose 4-O-acetylase-like acetyltransferase